MGVYVTVTPLGGQETFTRVWKRGKSSYYGLPGLGEENQREIPVKIESSWFVSSG